MTQAQTTPAALLRSQALWPNKGLGQHFLADLSYAQRIVDTAQLSAEDHVVEIGAGLGSLTVPICQQTQQVWCIEYDTRLLPILRQQCGAVQPHIIHTDALQFDFIELSQRIGAPLRILANLPYNISTPLLIRMVEQRAVIRDMTLMFQQEVADRITASPGSKAYGTLSIFCQMWCATAQLMTIAPQAFHPPPKVFSAVVRLVPRAMPLHPINHEAHFRAIVRAAFGQRRKMLRNALLPLTTDTAQTPLAGLDRAGIDPNRRGETLTPEEFAHLANHFFTSSPRASAPQ